MPLKSPEKYLELVEKSRLVEPTKMNKFLDKIRAHFDGKLPPDAKSLARLFEKKKLLTEWHNEKLLDGKYKGFFLGKYKLLGHIGTGGMSTRVAHDNSRATQTKARFSIRKCSWGQICRT